MKFSAAAMAVAAVSLFSTTHAAPLSFKDGEISGHLQHRRFSDLSDLPTPSAADEAMDGLDIAFEPGSSLLLPRFLNFFKRQSSVVSDDAPLTGARPAEASTSTTAGTTDTDLHTAVMAPNLESYGFSSELGSESSALTAVKKPKE